MNVLIFVVVGSAMGAQQTGEVTIPLSVWDEMQDELRSLGAPDTPPLGFAARERLLSGTFRRGLLEAHLAIEVEVLSENADIQVPLVDINASIQEVRVDGRRTSLERGERFFKARLNSAGVHSISIRFLWGEERDRFARQIRLLLPPAGPTRVDVLLPEVDIEAKLGQGTLLNTTESGSATRVLGYLDASGQVNLTWRRAPRYEQDRTVRLEASALALMTMDRTFVEGRVAVAFTVLEGAVDRVDLVFPAGVELLSVEGDAVLQWFRAADRPDTVTVFLRYLVDEKAELSVRYRSVRAPEDPDFVLPLPLALSDAPVPGLVGVQGLAGFDVNVTAVDGAERIELRDLPVELEALSSTPVRFGFRYNERPSIRVSTKRLDDVSLTTAIADSLQASTVALEDGTDVTRLRIRMRNNTRQYLRLELPPSAELSHVAIDGASVRPGVGEDGTLLIPIQQSENFGRRGRYHVVTSGETLGGIAKDYYADPSEWSRIVDANSVLSGPYDLAPGQSLRIPFRDASVRESGFSIEVAYRMKRNGLAWFGSRQFNLPQLDVDVRSAVWHVYFPHRFEPLGFRSNLTQLTARRYDPLSRIRNFFGNALRVRNAWGAGKYKSILSQRRELYQKESRVKQGTDDVLTRFPLVGRRLRFRRLLLGTEQPMVWVRFVDRQIQSAVHFLVLIGVSLLTFGLWGFRPSVGRGISVRRWIWFFGALAICFLLGLFFIGTYRRVVWGMDIALLATLILRAGSGLRDCFVNWLRSPKAWWESLKFSNVMFLLGTLGFLSVTLLVPLLTSLVVLMILGVWVFLDEKRRRYA